MTMADLMAKQENKTLNLSRGDEVEGEVVEILAQEIILDLGTKSEGVLPKKDLSPEQAANLKVGDKVITFVLQTENESGQVVLGLQRTLPSTRGRGSFNKNWDKFQKAVDSKQVFKGRALELNRGGLIVETEGVRGFLPSSQVALSTASNLEDMVGKDIDVCVIEVDPNQNRLIFSQKTNLSEDTKKKLGKLKVGDKVKGEVAAVMPFGVFVSLEDGVEGLVHISEISWEKIEDPGSVYKVGDSLEAQVTSVDESTGRVNLSAKRLQKDPFAEKSKELVVDDVIKATITKISSQGVSLELANGLEGIIPSNKTEPDANYEVGKSITCLIDSIDTSKRRVVLAPFITSTKDLIYK